MAQPGRGGRTLSENLKNSASGLLLIAIVVGLGVGAALREPPARGDLVEVRGNLLAYEFENHEVWVAVLSLAGRKDRFLTYAVTMATRPVPFHRGSEIRLFVRRPPGPATFESGVIRSYGLWVDGKTVQTLEADFDIDRRSNRDAVILGVLVVAIMVILALRRREPRQHPPTHDLS